MKSLEENEETDWRCRVGIPLCSKVEADQAGVFQLQNQVTASQFFVNLTKLAFLKALTITKDFTENTELNKRRSRLVAALE